MKRDVLRLFALNRTATRLFLAAIGLSFFLLPFAAYWNSQAAGTYSGRVFKDFNSNGTYNTAGGVSNPAIDVGVQSVTVTLYDSTGAASGTANTAADGTFSITSSGVGPYRVEFTSLPTGYFPSARSTDSVDGGTTTTDAGSTVQFVANGGDTDINLALNVPDDYCQNNPLICTTAMTFGNNNSYTALTFPMSYSSDKDGNINGSTSGGGSAMSYSPARPVPTTIANTNQIGTAYGVAWNKSNQTVYVSSFMKRKAPSGSSTNETTGGIYRMSPTSAFSPALYVDLNSVFGAGTTGANPHPRSTTNWNNDTTTRDTVGKRGLGDLDISPDNSTLYTVNLTDRRLYAIPTSGTLNNTTILRYDIPTSGIATSTGRTCNANDVRPFGLGFDSQGQLYVGGVCTGENSANNLDMRMYVWRFVSGTFTLVFNADNQTNWNRWATTATQDTGGFYAQAILADIVFDGSDMVLGFRDRLGDQLTSDGVGLNQAPYGRGVGNTARACWNGTIWNLESNGTCGSITTGGAGNTQGYGGGEYYYQDSAGDTGGESGLGSLLKVPGVPDIMATAYDAVNYATNGTEINNNYGSAGVQRYNNANGQNVGTYDVYLASTDSTEFNFWKTNGLGDIEALCDRAPIEVGNRVWLDVDSDGVQDSGESNLSGITVQLWADTDSDGTVDTLVGTAVTDTNGEYYFVGSTVADSNTTDNIGQINGGIIPGRAYQVRIPASQFGAGQPLNNRLRSPNDIDGTPNGDSRDSDGMASSGNVVANFVAGSAGNNNHTFDFGFYVAPTAATVPVGGRIQAADGAGIRNVVVNLVLQNGTTQSTRTGAFGYYRFDDVEVGQTVAVEVRAKRFTFKQPSRVFTLQEAMEDLDFTAIE